jgi:hypothetical protein
MGKETGMEYGAIIKQAWQMVWRRRFLWLLGMFAGGGAGFGNGVNYNFGGGGGGGRGGSGSSVGPGAGPTSEQINAWVMANVGLLIAIVVGALLLVLALIVVSFIARGGLTFATLELGQGRPGKPAWRAGMRYFWRFVGIALIQVAVIAAFLAVGLAFGALAFFVGFAVNQALGIVLGLLAVLVFLALLAVLIPVGILAHIIIMYAERAMIDRDMGPISGLVEGWRIFRTRFGESLLVWLISAGLGIGVGIVTILGVIVLLVPLGGIGFLIYLATQFTAPFIVYAAVAGLLFIVAVWVLSGIVNSYFYSYWSLAYLQLTGRTTTEVARS